MLHQHCLPLIHKNAQINLIKEIKHN